ncbi:PQQ-binding-like beta-propeller repeat protein [Actinoallomurus iriomotensis]|uniref:Pyrrolo-quinoline quinone repeat domain-containing protein n=1 Tax=Actinoallomurus iriomotensis TaxID=478107 RepID=A0A9W6VVU0_9ACTN|nr:PQQ-binding-like beta-propeller repeat protein [Actinoallomurus iriomotensis]GLY80076.1 hypothetical protein Airi01_083430 [Actinoallomurus iriomotensis]
MGDVSVQWSVPLPDGPDGTLLALPEGGCLVAAGGFVGLARPPGEFRVLAEAETMVRSAPVLLPERRFARAEDGFVVVRDRETGTTCARWRETIVTELATAPDGDLLYARWSKQDGDELTKAAADGTVRWRRSLTGRAGAAPLAVNELIVAADGATLRAYDAEGREGWVASHVGFGTQPPPTPYDEVTRPLAEFGDDVVVAELRWSDDGGIHLFDLREETVRRLEPPIAVHHPSTALPGRGVVAMGPTTIAGDGTTTRRVVLLDPSGQVSWTHELTVEPRALLATPSGDVILGASPDLDYWEKYHRWYTLSAECLLRCLAGDSGAERWTWRPGEPLTYQPSVDAAGTVFAAGRGRLWALA